MKDEKITLPSGEVVSKEFYDKLKSVTDKRPRTVIDKLMRDGSCTTAELIEMGYSHAPRAKRDVIDQGIPVKMKMVKNPETGQKMAKYMLGNWEEYKKQNSLAKTKGRNNLSDKLKQKLIEENGARCAIYGEEFPEALLQTDHRIPFEIGGDPEDMMDTSKFMLLSPSANRAKSWACEHCENWEKKDENMCSSCYYADPVGYTHISGEEERRLDLVFKSGEIKDYDFLIESARRDNVSVKNELSRIIAYFKGLDKEK